MRKRLTEDEVDELIDEMSEKEILWAILEQSIETNRHLRMVSMAITIVLLIAGLALAGAVISVAAAR